MSLKRWTLLASTALAVPCAGAGYSFFFTISNTVTPDNPVATVTLWAAFPPWQYAFGLSRTEAWSDPDAGGFSNPEALIEQYYHCDPGNVSPDGDSILSIRLFQVHNLGGYFADTSNPLRLWSATWSTDDFTPRQVPIWTKSKDFYVYIDGGGGWENSYGPDFTEAQGLIEVVPRCYPDFTGDHVLDLFDFLAFVNFFNMTDVAADCTADGAFDLFDFLCFINAFNAGC